MNRSFVFFCIATLSSAAWAQDKQANPPTPTEAVTIPLSQEETLNRLIAIVRRHETQIKTHEDQIETLQKGAAEQAAKIESIHEKQTADTLNLAKQIASIANDLATQQQEDQKISEALANTNKELLAAISAATADIAKLKEGKADKSRFWETLAGKLGCAVKGAAVVVGMITGKKINVPDSLCS
ncbi:hypothetical protein LXT21_44280 [Myxococcus sp. K38C18041901]|uniref:hypothetical protein n=1 Tax=Myxococcus guangdongensis TaxID=2906760 RepID=UPI0020A7472D|nr:hypothetical protein [Myxococcus guangdongensis]MCP3065808.1 hypothetical protein [Myxococcus guangdongensis]